MTGRIVTTVKAASAATIALAAVAGLAACSGSAQGEETAGSGSTAGSIPSSSASTSADTSTASGASGTWTETGDYQTPGGQESVSVTLTAKDGVVTAVAVKGSGGSPNSQRYQSAFISGVSGEVVGKQLSTLKVGAVSGSSLTGNGFNAAVDKIRDDAA